MMPMGFMPGFMYRGRLTRVLTVGIVLTAVCGVTAAADEAPQNTAREPGLTGAAKLYRKAGDDIRFTFDAHGLAGKAHGTFGFSHHGGNVGAGGGYATGRVDCLLSGGTVAVATGVITRTDISGWAGRRVGFTVDAGTHPQRLGYSWAAGGDPATMDVAPCLSSAPIETVQDGGFTVAPFDPGL